MAVFSHIGTAFGWSSGAGQDCTLTVPTGAAAGDKLIVGIQSNQLADGNQSTGPSGWTLVDFWPDYTPPLEMWERTMQSGDTSWNWSLANVRLNGMISAYRTSLASWPTVEWSNYSGHLENDVVTPVDYPVATQSSAWVGSYFYVAICSFYMPWQGTGYPWAADWDMGISGQVSGDPPDGWSGITVLPHAFQIGIGGDLYPSGNGAGKGVLFPVWAHFEDGQPVNGSFFRIYQLDGSGIGWSYAAGITAKMAIPTPPAAVSKYGWDIVAA